MSVQLAIIIESIIFQKPLDPSQVGRFTSPLFRIKMPDHHHRADIKEKFRHLTPLQADLVATTGEFVGTFWFLFFAYASQLMISDATAEQPGIAGASVVIYTALAW